MATSSGRANVQSDAELALAFDCSDELRRSSLFVSSLNPSTIFRGETLTLYVLVRG